MKKALLKRWVFRVQKNFFVELEDIMLFSRLFYNLSSLMLNLLILNDLRRVLTTQACSYSCPRG